MQLFSTVFSLFVAQLGKPVAQLSVISVYYAVVGLVTAGHITQPNVLFIVADDLGRQSMLS